MTRLVAAATAQFYPTPLRVVGGIARIIEIEAFAKGEMRLLDPCCGKGTALAFLKGLLERQSVPSGNSVRLETYGIELDSERASAARAKLGNVLTTDAKTARVSPAAFDLVLHNPPYDSGQGIGAAKRLEHLFLRRITGLIRPAGLLIHIIPQGSLAVSAEYLASHYNDLTVYRFPDLEYGVFRQIVVLGYKRAVVNHASDRELIKRLRSWSEADGDVLPILPGCPENISELKELLAGCGLEPAQLVIAEPEIGKELKELAKRPPARPLDDPALELEFDDDPAEVGKTYRVTPGENKVAKFIFTAGEYSREAAFEEAGMRGVWSNRVGREQLLVHRPNRRNAVRPLLPLRDGQAALLTSIGLLDNLRLTDENSANPVLVKGRAYKEFQTREVRTDERGREISRTERQTLRTALHVLDLTTGELSVVPPGEMNEFVARYRSGIRRVMLDNYPPLYVPRRFQPDPEIRRIEAGIPLLKRQPLGGQRIAIVGAAISLRHRKGTVISAEQGAGKSFQGAAAAWIAGMRRVVVVCPSHLTLKWVREVEKTVPGAKGIVVRTVTELQNATRLIARHEARFAAAKGQPKRYGDQAYSPYFVVISKEMLKLDSRWQPAVLWQPPRPVVRLRDESGCITSVKLPHCPRCGSLITSQADEEVALSREALTTKKHFCSAAVQNGRGKSVSCGEPLWQKTAKPVGEPLFSTKKSINPYPATTPGPRRVSLAGYIKTRLKYYFDLAILDETHEYKARGSAQGIATGVLAAACKRVLALSGTFAGGYSSNLFHLLYRFTDEIRQDYAAHDEMGWAWDYGIIERLTFKNDPPGSAEKNVVADGAMSARREERVRYREAPGLNPAVLLRLLSYTVFLKLADVANDLPPYSEHVLEVPLDTEKLSVADSARPVSQAESYARMESDLLTTVRQQLARGSSRLLGAMLQALLGWIDNPVLPETVTDKAKGVVVASAPALPAERLYPKEARLVELYRQEHIAGRKMLVFIANTNVRDIAPRLSSVLETHAGAKIAILRGSLVAPARREEWVEARLREGIDVLICHPRLVATGLDLLAFQSIVFYQVEQSVYIMRQASRRSWRIGQTEPIRVYHLVYSATMQTRALRLQAKKMQAANLLDGELSAEGLVGVLEGDIGTETGGESGAGSDNLLIELARSLLAQAEQGGGNNPNNTDSNESLESLLAQMRQNEAAQNAFVTAESESGNPDILSDEEMAGAIAELTEALNALANIEPEPKTETMPTGTTRLARPKVELVELPSGRLEQLSLFDLVESR